MKSKTFVIPFIVGVEPMKRLLIADFENDNEYEAIEPQLFDDEINGKGLRILVYRKDKFVDVYYQKGVRINQETFSIGKGIGVLQETEIKPDLFLINQNGVDLHVAFSDMKDRLIELRIKESTTSKKRLNFLAPVGNDIKHPKQLFLAYMKEFDFVLKNKTIFIVKIDDRHLKPANFPLYRNGKKLFFARYSNHPQVGTLNPPGNLPFICDFVETGWVEAAGLLVQFHKGKVTTIKPKDKDNTISVEFPDGMPNLIELDEGINYTGKWIYKTDNQAITGGIFKFLRTGDKTDIHIQVTRNWIPKNLPLNLNLFTFFVKTFRTWPATYFWEGRVDLSDGMAMSGEWRRTGG
jgi:hypothetical protein